MVACAAVSSQSHIILAVPMTTSALTVDQLKQNLITAVENGRTPVLDVLGELEKASISREILEQTRIGAAVNEVRKRIAEQWPDVSKRCRGLIKCWQKLVSSEGGTASGTSSANATPNLVSPSAARLMRRVTPGTPSNRRVSSTGLVNGRSTNVSPAGLLSAPKGVASPNGFHKSMSVGTDLSKAEDVRNGKRKLEDTPASTIKRTKTSAGPLVGTLSTSVSAARMAVRQSTTELVAQLSQDLPEHMSIGSSIREHEEKVKREQLDEELALQLNGTGNPYLAPERRKRKYERKIKPEPEPEPLDERRGGLILRIPRLAPVKEDIEESKEVSQVPNMPSRPGSSASMVRTDTEATTSVSKTKKVDWMAMVPALESLKLKVEERRKAQSKVLEDPTKLYLMKVREREVLALPYLDVTAKPDFLHYQYAEPNQFYAEENFAYGAERNI